MHVLSLTTKDLHVLFHALLRTYEETCRDAGFDPEKGEPEPADIDAVESDLIARLKLLLDKIGTIDPE